MKKITFFSPMALGGGGGFQEWLSSTTKLLSNDYKISVIEGNLGSHRRWDNNDVVKRFLNVELRSIKMLRVLGDWYFPDFKKWGELFYSFKESDYTYLNHSFRLHDPITKILAFFSGTKIILGCHSPFQESPFKKIYFYFFKIFILLFFDSVHVLNSDSERLMISSGSKKVFLIPNYLLMETPPSKPEANPDGAFVFVGRDEHQKGIDILTQAIRSIIPEYPKTIFHFFGSGKEKLPIRKLQHDFPHNVFDFGYEIEKSKIFSGKSFFILSSRKEPFGLVIIEAMSYGVPVIATKTSGPKDIIEDGKDGIFSESISSEGLANAIIKAISIDRGKYQEMSLNAFHKSRTKYTKEKFLESFKKMLESI